METKIWKTDAAQPAAQALQEAASWLRTGRTVAFPTETVYG
ncbi:translation factor, partial [Paenibacillus validus]|nr:translation factor [Paenibacillus validus]